MHVIGIGFRPLDKRASDAVVLSDVVLVNNRLLEVFKNYQEYETVKDKLLVHGSVYETLDYVSDNYKKLRLVLLAAGDPMFFGIGRLVVERLGRDVVEVFPDLSSIQVAFSRVRETSNNALLMSLHGGPDPSKRRKLEHEISELPALLKEHHKIAILTDAVNSPEKIAETIRKISDMKMYVCERIGYSDEKVITGTPEEISRQSFEHPNVVILVQSGTQQSPAAPYSVFGLKESEIQHSKGLITKDEVRAVTIHKLGLPANGVLWDIGAGSGSVSIEAARICPWLKVFAVEKKEEQLDYITANKDSFKTYNVEIIKGEAPEILSGLPAPDRVFIGGSGGNLGEILNTVSNKMRSGLVVINTTTLENFNEAVQCLDKHGFEVDISEVSVSRSKMISQKRHMSALNPIFIVRGEKP